MLKKENDELNQKVIKLQDELYGARLAAKYMDKEISGRYSDVFIEIPQKLALIHKYYAIYTLFVGVH